jgi:hypothetical protein
MYWRKIINDVLSVRTYFYLQYFFRERCWNLGLTDEQFAARLRRRLFDADAPADAGQRYAQLSQ